LLPPARRKVVTKNEFVDRVADRSGLGKGEAAKAVDAVLDSLQEVLSRGGEVNFTGFGKFTVADRSARQGVNPQTGEKIQIAASRVPRFSAGSQLKSAVKSGA
jgi:DNA-binding protein HU-beta